MQNERVARYLDLLTTGEKHDSHERPRRRSISWRSCSFSSAKRRSAASAVSRLLLRLGQPLGQFASLGRRQQSSAVAGSNNRSFLPSRSKCKPNTALGSRPSTSSILTYSPSMSRNPWSGGFK